MSKLRWGIMGTGNIAHTFAKGLATSQTGTLVAVGSRTQEAADKFGASYEVTRNHANYQGLVNDSEVDAIYISLPNHLHAEWTIKCAVGKKHILCEKPFTVNYGETDEVFEAVKHNDVFLMEAFMYRCHPQTAKLQQLIQEKAIGDVRLIQSNFSYNLGPQFTNIRLSNPAAGGGIMDVGCYTASMARLVAGAEPIAVAGVAHIGAVSRVDEWAVASLKFPDGCVAALSTGCEVGIDNTLRIFGSKGSIIVPNPWFPGEKDNKIVLNANGNTEEIIVNCDVPLYSMEADTVANYLADRQAPSPCMTWEDTLGNMATLDTWRQSIGLVFDCER